MEPAAGMVIEPQTILVLRRECQCQAIFGQGKSVRFARCAVVANWRFSRPGAPLPLPPQRCRVDAELLANPQGRLGRVWRSAPLEHDIDWRARLARTEILPAASRVHRQVVFEIAS
jgi:hypothetical protein